MFAFSLGLAQVLFFINFFWSMFRGPKAPRNPWESATLEWTIDFPIPHGNFVKEVVVKTGPHEYSHPALKGRDWISQTEELPKK